VVHPPHCSYTRISTDEENQPTSLHNGGRYHYYACSARQKYGPKACDGERLSREKIEAAVIRQLTSIYRDEHVIGEALAKAK
jgi:hypothetical protein